MAESVDCSDFCRLCLVKEQVNTPIFEELGDLQQIYIKITACLPIKVSLEDPLPKRICDECSYKLDQQYNFWNTSINAEKQLRQWLGLPEEPPTKSENVSGKIKREKDNYESPSKRPRRNARRKAAQHVRQAAAAAIAASDSGPGEDMDLDAFTKEENDSDNDFHDNNESMEDSTYANVGLDSEEHGEAGPSGLQKGAVTSTNSGTDAGGPGHNKINRQTKEGIKFDESFYEKLDNNSYKCKNCDSTFKTIHTLKRHAKKHEIAELKYPCTICTKVFSEQCMLRSHIVTHTSDRPFVCTICNKNFKRKGELKKHNSTHIDAKHKCSYCDYHTTFKSNLDIHIKRLHTQDQTYKCEHCPKKYNTKNDYDRHIAVHINTKKYTCDVCDKSYPYHSSYLIHRRKHDPEYIEKIYRCEYCTYSTTRSTYLRYHITSRHEGICEVCDICGKQVTVSYLKRHKQLHTKVKPFKCSTCFKSFLKKTYLLNHMKTHNGVKQYQCKDCGQCFTQKITLLKHEERHEKHPSYTCNICLKVFTLKKLLKTHVKTHKPLL